MKIFGVFTIRWAARDGTRYERRYLSLNTYTVPAAYEPNSNIAAWSERPTAITSTARYRFMTERSSQNGGESWSQWSAPVIDGYLAEDGRAFTIKGSAAGVIPYGGNLPNAPVEGAIYLDNRASTSDIEKYENSTWTGVAADLNDAYLVDGHIYMKIRSQSTSASLLRWEDEGDIKGPKGDDGDDAYSVSVQPGILMFTQSISDGSLDAPKSANVVVKKGNSNDAVSHTVSVTGASNCTNSLDNDTISVTPNPGKDNGYVTMSVAIANGPTFTVTLPFYCNLLKSWQETVEGGVETIVARDISKVVNDGDGSKTINESKSVFNSIRDAVTSLLQWRTSKQSQYDGYSQRIDNTNTQLNSAEVSLSRLTKKVNDGKNLLSLTMGWESYNGAAVSYDKKNFGVWDNDSDLYSPAVIMAEGETLCFSAYMNSTAGGSNNWFVGYGPNPPTHLSDLYYNAHMSIQLTQKSGDSITIDGVTYHRYYFVLSGSTFADQYITFNYAASDKLFCPQVEVGNTPSEFSANSQETSSQVKQTADEIEAKVNRTGVSITDGKIKAKTGKFEIYNEDETVKTFEIDSNGNLKSAGGAQFEGKVKATSGEFNGIVKATMVYTPTDNAAGGEWAINPAFNNPNCYFCQPGWGGSTIILPDPTEYDGLEISFLTPFGTRQTGTTWVRVATGVSYNICFSPYDAVTINGNTYYLPRQDGTMMQSSNKVYLPYNQLVKMRAINGEWYVVEGRVVASS